MTELVAYYKDKPRKETPGAANVVQRDISKASGVKVIGNADVLPGVVYVVAPHQDQTLLVPFAQYDMWSLRERFNETLRVMNTLGAKTIKCTTYSSSARRAGIHLNILGRTRFGAKSEQLQQSGFDYDTKGRGALPRDPGPLRWPDEPGMEGAVQSVLENGSTSTSISIESSSKYKVQSDLWVSLKKAGFHLGAETESTSVTTLKVEATFPTREELGLK